jgi:myosin heavy subunit
LTKKKWELPDFEILNKSGCYTVAAEPFEFPEIEQAFKDLNFTPAETTMVYRITQSVLLIANFTYFVSQDAKKPHKITSTELLKDVVDLLEVDPVEFEYRLVTKTSIMMKVSTT